MALSAVSRECATACVCGSQSVCKLRGLFNLD